MMSGGEAVDRSSYLFYRIARFSVEGELDIFNHLERKTLVEVLLSMDVSL